MKTILAGSVALLLGSATIAAASSQLLVFGDSTVDAGNEQAILGDEWNIEFYPEGQRTDGTTFAHKLGATFESGYNFAVGGARTLDNGDIKPDFAAQRQTFFTSGIDLSHVTDTIIWFGGNDFRDLFAAGLPTPAGVAAASTAIITEIVTGIGELSTAGLTDFLVFGMPDLSRFPAVASQPFAPLVRGAVEGYDAALQAALSDFAGATGLNIDFFSAIGLADDVFANADALGLTNLLESACTEVAGVVVSCVDPEGYFFYDSIHPTDAIHDLIAEAVAERLSPTEIPLPAGFPLLMSGLVLFGLASRRHRSRA